MADGSVKIGVGLSISKAERDLEKLKAKINDLEDDLNERSQKRSGIEARLNQARSEAEKTEKEIQRLNDLISEGERFLKDDYKGNVSSDDYNRVAGAVENLKGQLAEQEKLQKTQLKDIEKITKEYSKADAEIEKGNKSLEKMQEQAGDMEKAIAAARPGEQLSQAIDTARGSLKKFLKYAIGIRSTFILFRRLKSAITDSVKAFAEYDDETKNNIQGLKDSLQALKLSWGAAFAPIFNVVAPLIQKFIGWITNAANAVAKFIALLSGRSSYKKAIVNNNGMADSLDDVAESAKEAKAQLMGFDELNILNAPSNGGKDEPGSNVTMVDEAIDPYDGSFLSDLALSVNDVLFDWSNLNPEQIAQKAISGLSMFLGGATGFMIAGVPGAIVGTLLGLGLSLIANAAMFDHDGVISPDEIASMLKIALNGLVGGAIGFAIGGPGGALIGATVATGITLLAKAIKPTLGAGSTSNLLSDIVNGLTYGIGGGVGGVIGFTLGGPGGAAIGAMLGLGLTFVVKKLLSSFGDDSKRSEYKDTLSWFVCGVLGLPTDEELLGWGKKAIDWIAEGLADFGTELYNLFVAPVKNVWDMITGKASPAGEDAGAEYESGLTSWAGTAENTLPGKAFGWIVGKVRGVFGLDSGKSEFEKISEESGAGVEKGLDSWKASAQDSMISRVFGSLVDKVKKFLGIASPSTVFESIGKDLDAGLEQGVKNNWSSIPSFFETAIDKIKRLMNFTWSFPKPKLPHFSVTWQDLAGIISIPHISVQWYAKGGIFDTASLIGVGEAGKEAVVPLERNTEWINLVANSIMDRMTASDFSNRLAEAFVSVPRPSIARGSVVPPNAISGSFGGDWSGNIMQELAALRREISALAQRPIEVDTTLELDRRVLGKAVTRYQAGAERAYG